MSTDLDPRYQKTHKLLQDSFMGLINEKPYHKITILEIADRAQINRSTFYLHYVDVLALLNDCLLDGVTLKETEPSINEIIFKPEILRSRTMRYLNFCLEHSDLMETVLNEFQTNPYFNDFYKANLLNQLCIQKILFQGDLTKFIPDHQIARYVLAGQARLLADWLDKKPSVSLEQLAVYYNSTEIRTNCVLLGVEIPDWMKQYN
jgi:AcrR family transcriptional regulator